MEKQVQPRRECRRFDRSCRFLSNGITASRSLRKNLRRRQHYISLDIAVLDDKGAPVHEISVPADSHFLLMQQAGGLQLRQLLRLHDYYEDVDYTAQETKLLQQETQELASKCSGRPEFCALINEIESLVHFAVNNKKAVVAIAD